MTNENPNMRRMPPPQVPHLEPELLHNGMARAYDGGSNVNRIQPLDAINTQFKRLSIDPTLVHDATLGNLNRDPLFRNHTPFSDEEDSYNEEEEEEDEDEPYQGWSLYRAKPTAAGQEPDWSRVTKSRMNLSQGDLDKLVKEQKKGFVAKTYSSLGRLKRKQIDDLIEELKRKDSRFNWAVVYIQAITKDTGRRGFTVTYVTITINLVLEKTLKPGVSSPRKPSARFKNDTAFELRRNGRGLSPIQGSHPQNTHPSLPPAARTNPVHMAQTDPRPQHPQQHQPPPLPPPQLLPQPHPQSHSQPPRQVHPSPHPQPQPQTLPQMHPQPHPPPHPQAQFQPPPQMHSPPHPPPHPQAQFQPPPQMHSPPHPPPDSQTQPRPLPQIQPQPHPHPHPQSRQQLPERLPANSGGFPPMHPPAQNQLPPGVQVINGPPPQPRLHIPPPAMVPPPSKQRPIHQQSGKGHSAQTKQIQPTSQIIHLGTKSPFKEKRAIDQWHDAESSNGDNDSDLFELAYDSSETDDSFLPNDFEQKDYKHYRSRHTSRGRREREIAYRTHRRPNANYPVSPRRRDSQYSHGEVDLILAKSSHRGQLVRSASVSHAARPPLKLVHASRSPRTRLPPPSLSSFHYPSLTNDIVVPKKWELEGLERQKEINDYVWRKRLEQMEDDLKRRERNIERREMRVGHFDLPERSPILDSYDRLDRMERLDRERRPIVEPPRRRDSFHYGGRLFR
ncbi:predicted protein [Uncinocarpus reesii 1704]|uniref:Uncharacterized protein n=1 Tax=Uncinocarpus reesii (strain UAMH 1704) TaxID=336963 RepID=C4JUZ8_UNCRE|nr:uncharacterized protein UREG_04951 [Uncinocarpus reesii 1704]EEP80109.1 predicted protein [Uncinocarpus reesii 1704]